MKPTSRPQVRMLHADLITCVTFLYFEHVLHNGTQRKQSNRSNLLTTFKMKGFVASAEIRVQVALIRMHVYVKW